MHRFCVTAVLIGLSASSAWAADPETITLGGVRKVSVTIEDEGKSWKIGVRMVPVRVFDPTTNSRLNRDKAKAFALQALARHQKKDSSFRATLSGATVEDALMDGAFFSLTLRLPHDGVKFSQEKVEKPVKPKAEQWSGESLFSRRGDYQGTISQLAEALNDDARDLSADAGKAKPRFDHSVAELEERAESRFGQLLSEVRADRLLLNNEKDELRLAITEAEERFLKALRNAVEQHEVSQKKEQRR